MPESYSFSPQFATIRSESPLAGMRPVSGIQHTPLSFREQKPIQIRSAGEELVGLGAIEGLNKGIGTALQGITTAYVTKREKEEKIAEDTLAHNRALDIAKIRSGKEGQTEEERVLEKKYREAQLANLESMTKERTGDKKPTSIKPSGFFDEVDLPENPEIPSEPTLTEENPDLPKEEPALQKPLNAIAPPVPAAQEDAAKTSRLKPLYFYRPDQMQEKPKEEIAFETYKAPEPTLLDISAAPETQRQRPKYSANDLLGTYESWQDAEKANKMLSEMLPEYQVKQVKKERIDGQDYYTVEPPSLKESSIDGKQVPEGMKVKSAKMDESGKVVYDLEPKKEIRQQVKALKEPLSEIDIMLRTINQIRSIYGGFSPGTGGVGAALSYIPGSDAADVERLTKTLQGNIAFKKLSDMKAASPTGGALGAISERELDLLASSLGSIDPKLSFFLFKQNLDEIENVLSRSKQGIEEEIQLIENPQKFQPIQSSKYKEGSTATNPKTGEKIVFKNGQWIPAK